MNATFPPPSDRRFAALALTALVHAVLLLGWLAARGLPPLPAAAEPAHIQWIDLLPRRAALPKPAPEPERPPERIRALAREAAPPGVILIPPPAPVLNADAQVAPASSAPSSAAAAPADGSPTASVSGSPPPLSAAPAGGSLVQGALRAAGGVARALRKENNAYIVAPPDSPQLRMRRGMEAAHEMAPNKLWEAPKMEELANPTGNGERHTRVRTALGSYCISNKSVGMAMALNPNENGSQLHTSNCLSGEEPTASQEWKTARDP